MKNKIFRRLLVSALLVCHMNVMAADIDLFVDPASTETTIPNVLIILDNTANWNTAFTNEMAALKSVLDGLAPNKFRVGLMLYTETGAGNGNPGGAYVRAALRLMDATNKPIYSNLINSLDINSDKGNGRSLGLAMMEAYAYFDSQAAYAGANKVKRDYNGNATATLSNQSKAVYALSGNAFASSSSNVYVPPVANACPKNHIIYIGNTTATGSVTKDNASENTIASNKLLASGGSAAIAEIPISPTGFSDNVANEWARYMKSTAHNITTYSVDVSQGTNGNGPANSALLKSMATASNGKYFKVDSTTGAGSQISDALNRIFSEIQSVNSVFASVSLPVSVNTQGTYLNQVYVGMFRPDPATLPRWSGNLKQYKLGYESGDTELKLLDADSADAINTQSGFITECARSYWTPLLTDSYWKFNSTAFDGGCVGKEGSNTPDGKMVEKGAQGYMLRGSTTRNLKTCSSSSCDSPTLVDFNASNVSAADLGAASTSERDTLISWFKGLDLLDENVNGVKDGTGASPNDVAEMRPSVHGDVVHSRPVALNYGTGTAPDVVVFYGGNDGVFRAVNGNRDGVSDLLGSKAGEELWSFVPTEFFSKIKRNYENITPVYFAGYSNLDALPKDYGPDGPVTAYKSDSKSYVYMTLRRGGKALYAFDASAPKDTFVMWKKTANELEGLGQTWSSAKVFYAKKFGTSPLLIMGGGYDECHDKDEDTNKCGTEGKKIFVMDANDGALLSNSSKFTTDDSVIADAMVIPDNNGYAKFIYVADLGGNIYRISGVDPNSEIGDTAPEDWTMTKIAALGGNGVDNRKFMFAPDVIDENGTYVLLLGSGDREKPVGFYSSAGSVNNRFYMIKDKPLDSNWLASESENCGGVGVICENSLYPITTSATPSASTLSEYKGWYLALGPTEQVVTSAITVFGTVTFSTHQPSGVDAVACSPTLGTAKVYNINYINAAPPTGATDRGSQIAGGGLPPSPVAGMVTLDDGTTVPFIIGSSPDSALKGGEPPTPPAIVRPKSRAYWNIRR